MGGGMVVVLATTGIGIEKVTCFIEIMGGAGILMLGAILTKGTLGLGIVDATNGGVTGLATDVVVKRAGNSIWGKVGILVAI